MKSLKLISAVMIALGLALSPMSAYAKHNGKKHAKHHQVKKHKVKKSKSAKSAVQQVPVVVPAQ